MMKRIMPVLLVVVFVLAMVGGCVQPAANEPATDKPAENAPATNEPAANAPEAAKPLKIAYFVSDLSNVFHQAQYDAAKKYAAEKYGAEVIVFDGQGDGTIMTQNIDQILAQGMDMATLHVWDDEAAIPGIKECLENDVVMASFFGPFIGTGIPCVRSDEAGVSYQMGVEMATAWVAAHPDKPVVTVQLGWPNHTEVKSGRTDPFVEGVLSVAPNATNLGCLDAGAGADAAKQIMADLLVTNPEVNLIYSEASNLTVGTMNALRDAGRGVCNADGSPITELVCSVDFDEVEMGEVYEATSSLKCSMGLPPIETAQARIDNLFAIYNGEVEQVGTTEVETFAKAYCISFWSMERSAAVSWLNEQFGTNVQ
jgi:ABC-type sugar transport system substrate-binding protein